MTIWHARRPGWSGEPFWLRVLRAIATLVAATALAAGAWGFAVLVILAGGSQ